jgi:hypothetical protein
MFYTKVLELYETEPLNGMFERLEWEDKIFIFNSGSYFIFLVAIILYVLAKVIANWLLTKCWKKKRARTIGAKLY